MLLIISHDFWNNNGISHIINEEQYLNIVKGEENIDTPDKFDKNAFSSFQPKNWGDLYYNYENRHGETQRHSILNALFEYVSSNTEKIQDENLRQAKLFLLSLHDINFSESHYRELITSTLLNESETDFIFLKLLTHKDLLLETIESHLTQEILPHLLNRSLIDFESIMHLQSQRGHAGYFMENICSLGIHHQLPKLSSETLCLLIDLSSIVSEYTSNIIDFFTSITSSQTYTESMLDAVTKLLSKPNFDLKIHIKTKSIAFENLRQFKELHMIETLFSVKNQNYIAIWEYESKDTVFPIWVFTNMFFDLVTKKYLPLLWNAKEESEFDIEKKRWIITKIFLSIEGLQEDEQKEALCDNIEIMTAFLRYQILSYTDTKSNTIFHSTTMDKREVDFLRYLSEKKNLVPIWVEKNKDCDSNFILEYFRAGKSGYKNSEQLVKALSREKSIIAQILGCLPEKVIQQIFENANITPTQLPENAGLSKTYSFKSRWNTMIELTRKALSRPVKKTTGKIGSAPFHSANSTPRLSSSSAHTPAFFHKSNVPTSPQKYSQINSQRDSSINPNNIAERRKSKGPTTPKKEPQFTTSNKSPYRPSTGTPTTPKKQAQISTQRDSSINPNNITVRRKSNAPTTPKKNIQEFPPFIYSPKKG